MTGFSSETCNVRMRYCLFLPKLSLPQRTSLEILPIYLAFLTGSWIFHLSYSSSEFHLALPFASLVPWSLQISFLWYFQCDSLHFLEPLMSWHSFSNSLLLLLPLDPSLLKKNLLEGLPGCQWLRLCFQGVWVRSLMGELRFYMLTGAAIKKKKLLGFCFLFMT